MHATKHLGFTFALTVAVAACGGSESTTSTTGTASATATGSGGEASTTSSSGTTTGSGGAGGGASELTIQTYSSDPAGPAVDSHLIVGAKEAVLVDGQFFKADAAKVVDLVKASGKTLTTVFLTHAHPDHYLGLEAIHAAFPQAKVVTTKAVLAEFNAKAPGTFAYLKGSLAGQIADALVTPEAITGTSITLEDQEITIFEAPHAGESGSAAALVLPGKKAMIAGDLVYHDVHLVLAECEWQGWLDNLTAIKALGYDTFYPGHGGKTDMAVLDADSAYIKAVIPIMDGAATADAAKAAIKQKYPAYASEYLMGFSVDSYFTSCKKPL